MVVVNFIKFLMPSCLIQDVCVIISSFDNAVPARMKNFFIRFIDLSVSMTIVWSFHVLGHF